MKLILNMIVKNESKVILRCLNSVIDFIDGAVICDTGSTDDTIKIITDYFRDFHKSITIRRTTFQNFGQARNVALETAKKEYPNDALLFMDAGMEFQVAQQYPFHTMRDSFKGAILGLLRGCPHLSVTRAINGMWFSNTHITTCADAVRWVGACHEYLETVSPPTPVSVNAATIRCHQDGGNQEGQEKRYLEMLQNAYDDGDRSPRTIFYLAQSYREMGDYPMAIYYYAARVHNTACQFPEEKWYAGWKHAWCWEQAHPGDGQEIQRLYKKAWLMRPWRIEPLRDLLSYLERNNGNPDEINFYRHVIKNCPRPQGDLLFIEDIYEQ